MPAIDCSAQRPARYGITATDLGAGAMTLSEMLTGRWTRSARLRSRTRLLRSAAVSTAGTSGLYSDLPDEVLLAVAGVCRRDTCCSDAGVAGVSCGSASACGCKAIRHVAHPNAVLDKEDTGIARANAVRVLVSTH